MNAELTLRKICPDFDDWPNRWQIMPEDRQSGRELLAVLELFCEDLIRSGLAKNTILRHLTNAWLLGGELIGTVNEDETLRNCPAIELILKYVDEKGGPYSRHLESGAERNAFDATCRKLHKFLRKEKRSE